jgi:hypothetical protein
MPLVKNAFAGSWYPGTPSQIIAKLEEFALKAKRPQKLKKPPSSGVVPHAAWLYSGAIAYEVWATLAEKKPEIVFLFGGHVHPYQRSLIFVDDGFQTPMGPIECHKEVSEGLAGAFRFRVADASSWESDNTVEVHFPMIRHLMPQAKVVVLHLPPRDVILDVVDLVMEVVRRFGLNAIFVGSTDLTHYGPRYGFTPYGSGDRAHRWAKGENDQAFINKLLELDPQGCLEEGLSNYNACCPGAAAAAVTAARLSGGEFGELLTHMTSHEVVPVDEPEDFVGYCSVVF